MPGRLEGSSDAPEVVEFAAGADDVKPGLDADTSPDESSSKFRDDPWSISSIMPRDTLNKVPHEEL
jgi:hypothetical protein